MHPKSKDRSTNIKVLHDAALAKKAEKAETEKAKPRRSKYGDKLAALRRKPRD